MKNFDKVVEDGDLMFVVGAAGACVHVWDPRHGVRTCRRARLRKVGECTTEERRVVRGEIERRAEEEHPATALLDDLVVDDDAPGDDLYSWSERRRWACV